MKTIRLLVLAPLVACAARTARADDLDRVNVVWTTPSANPAGSMPIGNGEVGLNVWVEEGGDLLFYIARTDAWSETSRLLKLGRVRVSLTPNPFAKGSPFRQELRLREGAIAISAGEPAVKLKVFVDADSPVVHVTGESARPVEVRASLETWRPQRRRIQGEAMQSNWTMRDAPGNVELWESADVVADAPADAVVWYHRNEDSVVPLTLKHQGLESLASLVKDPILHRTFGGRMGAAGFAKDGGTALKTPAPVSRFSLRVVAHASQPESAAAWEKEVAAIAAKAADSESAAKSTAAWWDAFWGRSWIFVEEGESAAAAIPVNRHALRLGADSGGGSRFAGLMSRASVYARPLKEAEVQSLAAGKPGDAPAVKGSLLAAWRFDGLRGGAVPNGAGGGLDAKPSGSPAFKEEAGTSAATMAEGHFEVADDPRFAFPRGFTLEAWIRPAGASARIFDKITAGQSDGFLFDTHPGRALRLIVGSETFHQDDVLKPGEWNHVAAVVDPASGGRRLYCNGRAVKAEGGASAEAAPSSRITQAYILQRWMAACSGRGNYPIKFNGSLFTVDPEFTGGPKQDADWRRWGDCFWWQNTRLPYFPMPASGDFDLLQPLFRFYRSHLPLAKARAKLYYDADGAYFQETISCFGTASNGDYGWGRGGHKPSEFLNMYIRHIWQQGLELVMLMQDAYDHTQDARFLSEELLPMAHEVLRYFETRFPKDAAGKLAIAPTQAVETYWYDVMNDTPNVAGLHAVVARLLALPRDAAPAVDRELWSRMKAAAPPLPVREEGGKKFILPAEKFRNKRDNCENPELYAVWPFRLFSVGRPDLEAGAETWRRRGEKGMNGWSYDGQAAAILGMTEEAKRQILHKVRNSHTNHRFPAMWGPNFDWLPDQDHGSNILLTLQHMVMLADGDKVHLLPAWPKDWNLRFRLHAPRKTVIEGEWRGGKTVSLKVDPPARKADVTVGEPR